MEQLYNYETTLTNSGKRTKIKKNEDINMTSLFWIENDEIDDWI